MKDQQEVLGINDNIRAGRKKISINFGKLMTKLCFSLHYNSVNSYLWPNQTEIYKFKVHVSNDYIKNELIKISLNGTMYDFLFLDNSVEKEGILSIHVYLIVKINIK